MDDLTKYVINNYQSLMTAEEKAAYKSILAEMKITNADNPARKRLLRNWISDDPAVHALLVAGPDRFKVNFRDRVLRDCAKDVFLNYCPRCEALAKTPTARQCPKCFFSWHEEA